MDPLVTVIDLYNLIEEHTEKLQPPGRKTDHSHLMWMLEQIEEEKVTGEKAHRWIGYIQGVLVACEVTTVEEMKALNRR